jgi:hypothetical protein
MRDLLQLLAQLQARDCQLEPLSNEQRELGTLLRVLGQLEERVARLDESALALGEHSKAAPRPSPSRHWPVGYTTS